MRVLFDFFINIARWACNSFDKSKKPLYSATSVAGVAQLVERNLAKVEVASSRLVSRSKFSSSMIRVCGFFHFCSEKRYGKKPFDFSPPSLFLPEIF